MNIVFIFIDDIGWGDMSCYGSTVTDKNGGPITPNLDALAAEGIRFTDGYVASPVCSPSRVGMLTGIEPARYAIHDFLNNKGANDNRNMNDWLDADTVTLSRTFQRAGYATGLFGKWHMGGGRDVNDAPFPQDYGFDESLTSFEGMGDRILYLDDGVPHGLSQANADVRGEIEWVEWELGADRHTDAAIDFITRAVGDGKPFYVHVPHDDVHDPYDTDPGKENDFDHITSNNRAKLFLSELHELDYEIGRLVDAIDALGVGGDTLIVVAGDNGAPIDATTDLLDRNGGLRGGKKSLWEGGLRNPFMVRMPGTVPAGQVNTTTAVSTLDLFPTFCSMAGLKLPDAPLAGENMEDVFRGSTRPRETVMFWEFATNPNIVAQGPKLAVREGDYKLLRNPDGTGRRLFDMTTNRAEDDADNLIDDPVHAGRIGRMESVLMNWYREVVLGEVGDVIELPGGPEPGLLLTDNYDLPGGDSAATGFGTGAGVNEGLDGRLGGSLSAGLSYVQTNMSKPASAHSITGDALVVASAPNPTAFQFSNDGSSPRDFGRELAGNVYEWRWVHELDDPDPSAARTTLSIADSSNPAGGVGGVNLGVQLDLVGDNTISVFKRIAGGSHAGAGAINTVVATGLPAGEPVDLRVVMDDSNDYVGFQTSYQIHVNGALVDTGSISFANDSRYLIFDTAPNTGPARYDDFALELNEVRVTPTTRLPEIRLSEIEPTPLAGSAARVRLYWTTRSGQVVRPQISANLKHWEDLDDSGQPLDVATEFGTIRWLELEIPESYQSGGFVRLRVLD